MLTDYEARGYALVTELLTGPELEALRDEATTLCRGRRGAFDGIVAAPPDEDDAAVLQRYLCVHFPHKLSSCLLRAASSPSALAVLTEIVGPNVKLVQSMLFMKPAGMPGQSWHQDEAHIPTRDRSLTALWIALDDATIDNGCLWVVPGSHGDGILHPLRASEDPRFDGTPEAYGFDDAAAVPVEVPAGSAVVFNGYLLHRSLPNGRPDGTRRALVYHYMRAESLLPWMLPGPGETMATADHRDIVLVAGRDPYAWKGTIPGEPPRLRQAPGPLIPPTQTVTTTLPLALPSST